MRDHALVALCAVMALMTHAPATFAQSAARVQPSSSEEAKAEASAHFRRGAELFQDGLYRPALVELQRAYEIAPNYRVLFNVGQAHIALGEFVEAIQSYEQYLEQGGSEIDAARRGDVQGQLADLRRNVALVAIHVSQDGASVSIDGKEIGKAPLSGNVALSVGPHRISARAENGASASEEVHVAGGDQRQVTLTLAAPLATAREPNLEASPLPQKPALPIRTKWAIGLLASAGALAVTGGGLPLAAKAANDEYQKELKSEPGDPNAIQSAHDRLSRHALAADVMFGGALAVGIAGVVLMFVKGRSPKDQASTSRALEVGLSLRGLAARGRF